MPEISQSAVAHAAGVVVRSALKIRPKERFVVVCDAESADLGEALAAAGERAEALVTLTRVDQLRSISTGHTGERPHKVLPDTIRRAMLAAQASAFVATAPHAELSMREQLLHIVSACGVRHAHMAGISRASFARGICLDFDVMEKLGRQLTRKLEGAHTLEVDSPAGTRLHVALETMHRWVPQFGAVAAGYSANLPAGALYIPTESVRGTFVANASLGEFFGAREGILIRTPVRFYIDDGVVVRVEAPHSPALQRDIEAILQVSPNSSRIGLVVLGVNAGVDVPTGDATVDQTLPGMHLVIGDPTGRVTGVPWSARTSFVACGAGGTVVAHGSKIIDSGHLVPPSERS